MPETRQTMLEGLEPSPQSNVLRDAVARTVQELTSAGLLEAHHAAYVALAYELADAVVAGRRSGRASAAAMAAAQLREVLNDLPKPVETDAATAFKQWVEAELSRA